MNKPKKIVPMSQRFGFIGALCLAIGFIEYFLDYYGEFSYIFLVFGFVIITIALVMKYLETRQKL